MSLVFTYPTPQSPRRWNLILDAIHIDIMGLIGTM